VSQQWIQKGEQSSLLTHIAATEGVILRAGEKLTAFCNGP